LQVGIQIVLDKSVIKIFSIIFNYNLWYDYSTQSLSLSLSSLLFSLLMVGVSILWLSVAELLTLILLSWYMQQLLSPSPFSLSLDGGGFPFGG
jgi:hypothetical protein